MNVLLINPPIELYPKEFIAIIAPLGIAYIASFLEREGHTVQILDCLALSWKSPIKITRAGKTIKRLSPTDAYLKAYLKNFSPDVVGISNLVSPTEEETIRLAKKIKRWLPSCTVVVGGSNASARPGYFARDKYVDYVVVGEGEETMKELLEALPKGNISEVKGLVYKKRNKVVYNAPRPYISDLDTIPFPAWHLLPMDEYLNGQPAGIFVKKKRVATVCSSRGCPAHCSFCTNAAIWGSKWRARSAQNTINEIFILIKRYHVEEIQFVDSNISVKNSRFVELCKKLKKLHIPWLPSGGIMVMTMNPKLIKLMAESGCYAVQFGIEHGDLGMQRRIGKPVPLEMTKVISKACKKYGIWTHGNFVMGLPGETIESAKESLSYAMEADLDSISFFTALPLPGSRVYQEVFGKKAVDLYNMRFYLSKIRLSEVPVDTLNTIIKQSFMTFFFWKIKRELRPSSMLHRLSLIKSMDDIRFYLRMVHRYIQIETI